MGFQLPADEMQDLEKKYPEFQDEFFFDLARRVNGRTLSEIPAQWALYKAVEYVVKHDIPGDIVECGVWNGGSILIAAAALAHFGDTSRRLYLYDTFDGMPQPDSPLDFDCHGKSALLRYFVAQNEGRKWGFGGSEEMVREVVFTSGYPREKFVFVKGMVEQTLESTLPEKISVLRLDTDLYSSTYHEFVHGYPKLSSGGVLIVDDYGYYMGSRKATDRYIAENNLRLLLTRVTGSVHVAVKP